MSSLSILNHLHIMQVVQSLEAVDWKELTSKVLFKGDEPRVRLQYRQDGRYYITVEGEEDEIFDPQSDNSAKLMALKRFINLC